MELREGEVVADKFRLVRLLGQGGMGEVWVAQHTSLDIPCAVKFIHAESAQKLDVRARFEREAKAAAQLRTNTVVQILDYGIFEDTPYIAMEYLEGEPLSARIKRRGRLDAHETFRVIRDVGRALTKAHAAGIVHRDLKPENIFLVVDDDREIAKVLDFGVAKSADQLDSNTQTGALLGTPYFMSPEQAQGTKAVDHRADLWSIAVVAFRCLTGELPFKSTALGDLLIKIVTAPAPVPSHIAPGLPEGFDAWWLRASQRDPAHRFQSAKEMVQGLSMALGVSMPSTFGNTPMPGGATGAEIRGAQRQMRTMVADPADLPGGAGIPFQSPAHPSYASGPYPHAQQNPPQPPYPGQPPSPGQPPHPGQQAQPGQTMAAPTGSDMYPPPRQSYPSQPGSYGGMQAPVGINPMLTESQGSASVAGVPIALRPSASPGAGGKLAPIAVVLFICLAGVVGGVLWFGGQDETAASQAASGEDDADGARDDAPTEDAEEQRVDPGVSATVSADASAKPEGSSPAASASAESATSAKPPAPPAPPARPAPFPRPSPRPVMVPRPAPVPVPAPHPVPYDPAGF